MIFQRRSRPISRVGLKRVGGSLVQITAPEVFRRNACEEAGLMWILEMMLRYKIERVVSIILAHFYLERFMHR